MLQNLAVHGSSGYMRRALVLIRQRIARVTLLVIVLLCPATLQ